MNWILQYKKTKYSPITQQNNYKKKKQLIWHSTSTFAECPVSSEID